MKGITGFGGPMLAVPVLAPFLGVEHSVVIISLANVVSNVMLMWTNRHGATGHGALLTRLLAAGALGTIVGTVALTKLDDAVLSLALAGYVVLYIGLSLARPELSLSAGRGLALAAPAGLVGGLMHGALGNSGAVFASFYHSLKWPRTDFVFALTLTFLAFGVLQVGALAQLGTFGDDRLLQAVILLPPVVVATRLGESVSLRLDPAAFGRVILALLAIAAFTLIVGAVA